MSPMTEPMPNDEQMRAMVRNEAKVDSLAEKVGELKTSFEEFIDRFDADFDVFRDKIASFAVVGSAVEDQKKLIPALASKIDERCSSLDAKIEERSSARKDEIADLKTTVATLTEKVATNTVEKAEMKVKLDAITARVYYISGAAGLLAWIAARLFPHP